MKLILNNELEKKIVYKSLNRSKEVYIKLSQDKMRFTKSEREEFYNKAEKTVDILRKLEKE